MRMMLENPSIAETFDAVMASDGPEPLVEEFLRLVSPVMVFMRAATRDVEFAGSALREGDAVGLFYTAANRDPVLYENPDEFIPGRPNAGQHLSYRVVPMVGPDRKHLRPADQFASGWSDEVTASAKDPEGVLSAFFNRGIVASQWLARALRDNNTSMPPGTALATVIKTKGDFTQRILFRMGARLATGRSSFRTPREAGRPKPPSSACRRPR